MTNANRNRKTGRDRRANSTHDDPSDKRKDSVLVEEVAVNQPSRSLALSDYFGSRSVKMVEASTFFNEENVKIIRNIFNDEFQQEKYRDLVSANFKVTMEEIKKSEDIIAD